jgi:hypothetical protein
MAAPDYVAERDASCVKPGQEELREGLRDLDRRLGRIEFLAEGQGY